MMANFEEVAKQSCEKLKADSTFAKAAEFNVVGLSQGGLLARYMVEECEMPGKVRNIVTLGGPHMGVDKVPNCLSGFMCDVVNFIADAVIYTPLLQKHLAPAGYFRNVKNLNKYEKKSTFLPALNNDQDGDASAEPRKQSFGDINAAMLVMFDADTVVYPKESAWFQTLNTQGELMPLNATKFYSEDALGLKTLNEAGKISFESWPGNHLQFTEADVTAKIVPFLKQ